MSSSAYDMVSLGKAPGSTIRVLELAPGHPGDPLKGSLVLCSLEGDDGPLPYTALSYTWGQRTAEDTTIQLEGETTPVEVWTELKHALNALREREKCVRLWIDALCIDQSGYDEKSSQLPLMGEIYARASQTIVWLGPASADSDRAMRCVNMMDEEWRRLQGTPPITWFETSFQEADWDALGALMARPWWGRVWIIQEVLKSRDPVFRCGGATATLDGMVALEDARRAHTRAVEGMRRIASYPLNIILSAWALNKRDAHSDACPLFDWLGITHRFGFTQPRDRFYSLRSLVGPEARAALDPAEYDPRKLSDAQLNVRVSIHMLKQARHLLSLQYTWRRRTPGLSTWCPDWYTEQEGYVMLLFGARVELGPNDTLVLPRLSAQACGPKHAEARMRFVPDAEALTNEKAGECRLQIDGWRFDEVGFCDAFPVIELAAETTPELQARGRAGRVRALYEKCSAWKGVVEEHIKDKKPNPYGSPEALLSVFWRTLIADRDGDWQGPLDEDFGENLERFLASGGTDVQGSMAYLVPAVSRLARRSFIITKRGYLGLAPMGCRMSDVVCILTGGDVPFVLRPDKASSRGDSEGEGDIGGSTQYEWVGESYVHDIMRGEWVLGLEKAQKLNSEMVKFDIR
ncbi:heterokaryon incompatibility protein [Apiospora saccharicola]|uniref:Heterokaryon incompatibility protein n=1 Tax=Apiospora saccharicola TaxID=335842 RepID=A0ABR1U4W2_9PEZI